MKLAIIDSLIEDDYIKKMRNVYKSISLIDTWKDIKNQHGQIILESILHETLDPEILYIQVLNDDNIGKVDDLIKAISFCIESDVKLVNISLGITDISPNKLNELKMVCKGAIEKDILLIAARHNGGCQSYPADYKEVLSVSVDSSLKNLMLINRQDNEIVFPDRGFIRKRKQKCEILFGSSFLCTLITSYIFNKLKLHENLDTSSSVGTILSKSLESLENEKEFIVSDFSNICNKEILYITFMDDNQWDVEVISVFASKNNVTVTSKKDFFSQELGLEQFEILIVGSTEGVDEQEKNAIVKKSITNYCFEIITVLPTWNLLERLFLKENLGIDIRTMYL